MKAELKNNPSSQSPSPPNRELLLSLLSEKNVVFFFFPLVRLTECLGLWWLELELLA